MPRFRRSKSSSGFTLIELLIVIAIIGIIAAMLIPNLLDALDKARQKRSLADIRIMGTAMMSWVTDQNAGAAAAGQGTTTVDLANYAAITRADLVDLVLPRYVQTVPNLDGWKQPYDYFLDPADASSDSVIAIRSTGRDQQAEGTEYDVGAFEPTDYDQDLVWADGYFARWPARMIEN